MKTTEILLATAAALACASTGKARSLHSLDINVNGGSRVATPGVDTPAVATPGVQTPPVNGDDIDSYEPYNGNNYDDGFINFDDEISENAQDDEKNNRVARRGVESFSNYDDDDDRDFEDDGITDDDFTLTHDNSPVQQKANNEVDEDDENYNKLARRGDERYGDNQLNGDGDTPERRRGLFKSIYRSVTKGARNLGVGIRCGSNMQELVKQGMLYDPTLMAHDADFKAKQMRSIALKNRMMAGGATAAVDRDLRLMASERKTLEHEAHKRVTKMIVANDCRLPDDLIYGSGLQGSQYHTGTVLTSGTMGGVGVVPPVVGGVHVGHVGTYGSGSYGSGTMGAIPVSTYGTYQMHGVGMHGVGTYGTGMQGVGTYGTGMQGVGTFGTVMQGVGMQGGFQGKVNGGGVYCSDASSNTVGASGAALIAATLAASAAASIH